jgi:hypothetical protein
MKKIIPLLLGFILLTSHELFLKTEDYFLQPGEETELFLFNGTFDESDNIITRDRIIDPRIVGPGYTFIPSEKDYYDLNEATYLRFKTGKAGTYAAGISTHTRIIELSAVDFREYLEHEGLTDILADREAKGWAGSAARERYSKHVKALLQVGDRRTAHYKTVFGYPIEFVPLQNPYSLQKGDRLGFKLLWQGKPLADQVVHFAFRDAAGGEAAEERSTRTDPKGQFSIPLDGAGQWYVATIFMEEASEEGLDYESNWATLTFGVR